MRTYSSLVGRQVETVSGRSLGRCYDLRAEIRGSRLVVTGLAVGVRGVLERLGAGALPRARDFVPWDAVVRVEGSRFVVDDGTELQ